MAQPVIDLRCSGNITGTPLLAKNGQGTSVPCWARQICVCKGIHYDRADSALLEFVLMISG